VIAREKLNIAKAGLELAHRNMPASCG